ncbi:MAG: 16S rRNA (guanine(527)-N(7))-methyltransferase RsmG [Calditrichota bacterium]
MFNKMDNVNNLLERYRNLVLEANKRLNLVSPKDVDNALNRLISESLLPLSLPDLNLEPPLLDIGSGAGIPAIPLKIARPDWNFTLVESNRRKCSFLRLAATTLNLDKVDIINMRLETLINNALYHHRWGTVTCRGVGKFDEILDAARLLLKPGGRLVLWKGSSFNPSQYHSALSNWDNCKIWDFEGGVKLVVFTACVS